MFFAPLRVAFSYCIGWDIGGALSAFDAAFPLEIPMWQRAWSDVGIHLVLRPYDSVERHHRPSLLYETGLLGCHETLGSDNMIAGGHVQLLGLIRWLM